MKNIYLLGGAAQQGIVATHTVVVRVRRIRINALDVLKSGLADGNNIQVVPTCLL